MLPAFLAFVAFISGGGSELATLHFLRADFKRGIVGCALCFARYPYEMFRSWSFGRGEIRWRKIMHTRDSTAALTQ